MMTSWVTLRKISPSIFGCYWLRNRLGVGAEIKAAFTTGQRLYLVGLGPLKKRNHGSLLHMGGCFIEHATIFLLILSMLGPAKDRGPDHGTPRLGEFS